MLYATAATKKSGTDKPIRPTRSIPSFELFFQTSRLLISILALRSAHRPALLEAFPAKHRSPLCGTEGNSGFLPALRAVGLCFRAHGRGVSATTAAALGPFCFTSLAALGLVLEALVGKKHLFARGKNKFSGTPPTTHQSLLVFPEPLSPRAGA